MSVFDGTRESIEAAVAAGNLDPVLSAGPIAAVLALARKIDNWDAVVEAAIDYQRATGAKGRLPVPLHDNTSIPTYLKYCESLRLTPSTAVDSVAREVDPIDELKSKRFNRAQAG